MEMTYSAASVDEYIGRIPEDHRIPFTRLKGAVVTNLPRGFEECISYRMPSYSVPPSIYPAWYHCRPTEPLPFLSIAFQKNFIGYYHMGRYAMPELLAWFQTALAESTAQKLDTGKSCVWFKKINEIPYDLLGELASEVTPGEWIEIYERTLKR